MLCHPFQFHLMAAIFLFFPRAVTQKPVAFFKDHKDSLFGKHDIRFGIDVAEGFSYTGDEHYR